MTENVQTTEQTVREILGVTYDGFGFQNRNDLIERIVTVLDDDSKRFMEDDGDASEAAENVRAMLWSAFSDGGASAGATCELFYTLGRFDELGWVKEEGHWMDFNNYSVSSLQDRLERARAKAAVA